MTPDWQTKQKLSGPFTTVVCSQNTIDFRMGQRTTCMQSYGETRSWTGLLSVELHYVMVCLSGASADNVQ